MKFSNLTQLLLLSAATFDQPAQQVNAGAVKGVNLGGWFVLEPWITPSLFYPFLNKGEGQVAFDSYTFCEVMTRRGHEKGIKNYANNWMRAHWDSWITEETLKDLKEREVKRVRLPVGDWTVMPYGPYEDCMRGALEKIKWALDKCFENDIDVLIDVHTAKDSQNGFDNSGLRQNTDWTANDTFKYTQ